MHIAMASSWGPTDTTRATLPFLHARAAREQGDGVTLMLVHDAVLLAVKGLAENIHAFGPPALGPIFEELAGDPDVTLLVCKPCLEARHITSDALHPQTTIATMGDYHRAIREHSATVANYG